MRSVSDRWSGRPRKTGSSWSSPTSPRAMCCVGSRPICYRCCRSTTCSEVRSRATQKETGAPAPVRFGDGGLLLGRRFLGDTRFAVRGLLRSCRRLRRGRTHLRRDGLALGPLFGGVTRDHTILGFRLLRLRRLGRGGILGLLLFGGGLGFFVHG